MRAVGLTNGQLKRIFVEEIFILIGTAVLIGSFIYLFIYFHLIFLFIF
jgi:ABC-type antimicrobial peptide transport system permease subunit